MQFVLLFIDEAKDVFFYLMLIDFSLGNSWAWQLAVILLEIGQRSEWSHHSGLYEDGMIRSSGLLLPY